MKPWVVYKTTGYSSCLKHTVRHHTFSMTSALMNEDLCFVFLRFLNIYRLIHWINYLDVFIVCFLFLKLFSFIFISEMLYAIIVLPFWNVDCVSLFFYWRNDLGCSVKDISMKKSKNHTHNKTAEFTRTDQ